MLKSKMSTNLSNNVEILVSTQQRIALEIKKGVCTYPNILYDCFSTAKSYFITVEKILPSTNISTHKISALVCNNCKTSSLAYGKNRKENVLCIFNQSEGFQSNKENEEFILASNIETLEFYCFDLPLNDEEPNKISNFDGFLLISLFFKNT